MSSPPPDWMTTDEVAAYLGPLATDDQRIADATAAAKSQVEGRRSDLWTADDPPVFGPTADVHTGAVIYAALIYQSRVSPTGFAAYGDGAIDIPGDYQQAFMRAWRLMGFRRPVAI